MTFRNICREALHALSRNWMRSVLTVLGIVVGVAAFICVVAIGKAGSSRIQDQLQALGDNFIWIEAGSRARNGVRAGARGTKTLVLGDAQAILDQVPLIKASVPNVDGTIQVTGKPGKQFPDRGPVGPRGKLTGLPVTSVFADEFAAKLESSATARSCSHSS